MVKSREATGARKGLGKASERLCALRPPGQDRTGWAGD